MHGRNHKTTIKFTAFTHSLNASRFTQNSLVPPKTLAGDDGLDEIPEAFILLGHFLADLVDARAVAAVQLAADGVGQELLGQATGKGFVLRDNQLPKLVHG